MKLTDLMESKQLDELGIGDAARATWQGFKAGGLSGAKTGYTGEKLKQAGSDKANRIVNDLKQQFMGLVGGSGQSTSAQLKSFLTNNGLDTKSIPVAQGQSTLNNVAIDKAIRDVVRDNYQAIIAAQGGITSTPAVSTQPTTAPASAPMTSTLYSQAKSIVGKMSPAEKRKLLALLQKGTAVTPPAAVPAAVPKPRPSPVTSPSVTPPAAVPAPVRKIRRTTP